VFDQTARFMRSSLSSVRDLSFTLFSVYRLFNDKIEAYLDLLVYKVHEVFLFLHAKNWGLKSLIKKEAECYFVWAECKALMAPLQHHF
jgi:hypothetical protein